MKITAEQKQELLDFVNSIELEGTKQVEEPKPIKTKISEIAHNEVIHTETEAEYYRISILLHLAGKKWTSGDSYLEVNNFSIYRKLTCFYPHEGSYTDLMCFKEEGFNVIPSTQITGV